MAILGLVAGMRPIMLGTTFVALGNCGPASEIGAISCTGARLAGGYGTCWVVWTGGEGSGRCINSVWGETSFNGGPVMGGPVDDSGRAATSFLLDNAFLMSSMFLAVTTIFCFSAILGATKNGQTSYDKHQRQVKIN